MIKRLSAIICCLTIVLISSYSATANNSYAYISVEAFSIGSGYIVSPCKVKVDDKTTASEVLINIIKKSGYKAFYGGTQETNFYLGYIADGDLSYEQYNGYKATDSPRKAKKLNLNVNIASAVTSNIKENTTFFDKDDYKNYDKLLGEYMFTNGSGWMYTLNNKFLNSSLSDYKIASGDVLRVQYTLCFGQDIGGGASDNFYSVENKDELIKNLASYNRNDKKYKSAIKTASNLYATKKEINSAIKLLTNNLITQKSSESTTNSSVTKSTQRSTTTSTSIATTLKKTEKSTNKKINTTTRKETLQEKDEQASSTKSQTNSKNPILLVSIVTLIVLLGVLIFVLQKRGAKKQ